MSVLIKNLNIGSSYLVSSSIWRFFHVRSSQSNMHNIKIKVIKAPPIIRQTYIDKNENLKRTLSPHLFIYKPQISSMMSITLRMTGLALGIMTWVVGLTALISDQNVDYYVEALKKQDFVDCYWTGAKIVIVFPFAFHFLAGVRHLSFDTSKYLEKPQFYATGYAVIVISCILAICLGMMEDVRPKINETMVRKVSNETGK